MSRDRLDERLHDWASGRSAPAPTAAASRRLADVVAGRARERTRSRRRQVWGVAAAAGIVLGVGLVLGLTHDRGPAEWTPELLYADGSAVVPSDEALQVPGEGRLVARIGDDTVGLGERSAVQVERARGTSTRLRLDSGTLVADVRPRTAREGRFEVTCGPYLVQVVGTRFLLERGDDGGLEVVVRDGVVVVAGGAREHRVEAGYRLTIDAGGNSTLAPVEPSIERLTTLLSAVPASEIPPMPRAPRGGDDDPPPVPPGVSLRDDAPAPPEVVPPTLEELRRRLLDGDVATTTEELEARVEEDPADADAWMLLATARRKAGDREGAVGAWREVMDRGDEATANRARYEAALLLQELPDGHADAIVLLQALLASPVGVEALGAEVRLHLAESLRAEGRAEEARPVLEDLTRSYPGTGPALTAREMLDEKEDGP